MNFEIKKNDLGYFGIFEVEIKKEKVRQLRIERRLEKSRKRYHG